MPNIGVVFPASSPRANGLRPFSGRSRIFLFSMTWPSEDVSASSSGETALTSTSSRTSPGCSATRIPAVWSTWSGTRAIAVFLNPADSTLRVYSPTGRNGTSSSPRSLVFPVRDNPVLLLLILTVAAGTTAPVPSTTVTLMVPVATWADKGRAQQSARAQLNWRRFDKVIANSSQWYTIKTGGAAFQGGNVGCRADVFVLRREDIWSNLAQQRDQLGRIFLP